MDEKNILDEESLEQVSGGTVGVNFTLRCTECGSEDLEYLYTEIISKEMNLFHHHYRCRNCGHER